MGLVRGPDLLTLPGVSLMSRTPRLRRSLVRVGVLALVAVPLVVLAPSSPAQADGPGVGAPWVVSVPRRESSPRT